MTSRSFKLFAPENTPRAAIILIVVVYMATNFYHHNWTRDKAPNRGVIAWDIISYYTYLPAVFIYQDLKLDFVDSVVFNNEIKGWFKKAENGYGLIITSIGLSVLYSPFFLAAHALAPVFGEARTGYNSIYQFFIVFSALVYVVTGLLVLRKILLKYFSPHATALTLLAVGLGTNLYNYGTIEAAMPHSYNFALIIFFLYLFIKWYERPCFLNAVYTGLMLGFITMVRPTNILVLIPFLLWGVTSWKGLGDRLIFYFRRFHLVGVMILMFILAWLPQLLYWKYVTGHFLFYSYGEESARFYFDHPHIGEILIGFRKGWYIYTPLMLLATTGLIPLWKKLKEAFWPVLVFLVLMIYVQASWWSWWFGGGFGARTFVDIYGIMALPLAAVIDYLLQQRRKSVGIITVSMISLLTVFQVFQTFQYFLGGIHWVGNTKEMYMCNFLKLKPAENYWQSLTIPDSKLGRMGIYYYYPVVEDLTYLKEVSEETAIRIITEEIHANKRLMNDIKRYSKRENTSVEESINMVAVKIYNYKKDW